MPFEKTSDRRKWREVTLDELGFKADGIPRRYLEPALERVALVLCNLPSMKLEDVLREVVRGSDTMSLDVAEGAIAVHLEAGRIKVGSTMVSLRTTNSDGDDDEMDDEQRFVFPNPGLTTWWNTENENAEPLPVQSEIIRDQSTEDRDRWIYDECFKGTHYTGIIGELKKRAASNKWDFIESPQGVREAAKRYAERHNLQLPPRRKRPTKRK